MSQRDYLEELELDLDDIRYEFNRICLKVREVEGFLASVQKQLELTDYEEIKERLDHCVERLGKLPGEREACVRNQAALRKETEVLQEKERENELRQKELLEKKEKYQNVFEQEYQLGYVERVFVVTEDMEDQAKKSAASLPEALETRSRAICLEIFRKPIIRTEDICWITRLHCSPCLKNWMERAVFWT